MSTLRKNQIRITWWIMRLVVYTFLGFYFTFDQTNYPERTTDIIGIALLLIGILDTIWLFRRIGKKEET